MTGISESLIGMDKPDDGFSKLKDILAKNVGGGVLDLVWGPVEDYFAITEQRVDKEWGYYIDLYRSKQFVIKKIYVNPGEILSLQKHKKRSEIWRVEEGVASTIEEINKELYESTYVKNETTNIPCGKLHRLFNRTNKVICVLELQIGEPECDESDIERIEDKYNRK